MMPVNMGIFMESFSRLLLDTIFREESNSSQYSVIVSIHSKILDNENSVAEISPGMIAQVDIIRGRRSILEYFWQPVAKIKETAFKE